MTEQPSNTDGDASGKSDKVLSRTTESSNQDWWDRGGWVIALPAIVFAMIVLLLLSASG